MAPPKRPRSLQDGSLIVLDRFCFQLSIFASILDRIRLRFWSFLGAQMVPIGWHQTGGTPYLGDPSRSYGRLGAVLCSTCGLGSFWNPLRPFLGLFLAAPGAIFGLLGTHFRFADAVWGPFWGRCSLFTCRFCYFQLSILSMLHLNWVLRTARCAIKYVTCHVKHRRYSDLLSTRTHRKTAVSKS